MAHTGYVAATRRFGPARGEITGAIGDAVTTLPVVVAVAALTPLSVVHMLLGFAVAQVAWGAYYGAPVSVEPMKALAALVVAGSLTAEQFVAAGLLVGVALLVVGLTGTLGAVERWVSEPAVRGVQLAVALLLLEAGLRLSVDGPLMAGVGAAVALGAVVAGRRRTSALAVLCLGAAIAAWQSGVPSPHLPAFSPSLPTVRTVVAGGTLVGAVAQLAMTVGNAAVATSLLLAGYFDADVSSDELATSMGLTNLLAVPLGAIPMCHGSGGVAAKYAFGARTPAANVVLGVLYAAGAVVGAGLLAAYPVAMLGVLLAVVAAQLGATALETDDHTLTLAVGGLGAATNVGAAFALGVLVHLWRERDRGDSSAGR